jgi:hypothetical protein
MIAVKRVLSFDEFAASNRITLLHGPIGRKLNFILCGYVLPILGVAALPFVGWLAVRAWHEPGDHAGLFGVLCGMLAMCAYYALYPLLFLRKMKTLYRQQQLDREWEIEISERAFTAN